MQKFLRASVLAALAVPSMAAYADAGELKLTMANGRVTLIAHDVTVRQILDEWARVGQTRIVNGDKILGPPVTIELRDQPEAAVLDAVLRSAAGYIVAPRAGGVGASVYDRIMILPTSRPPAVSAAAPVFSRPTPQLQPVMPPVDDGDPADPAAVPAGVVPPPGAQPFPGQYPVMQPGPTTTPRPGLTPGIPSTPGTNPYQPGRIPGMGPATTPGPPTYPGVPGMPGGPPVVPGAPVRPGGGGPGGGPGGG